MNSSLTKNTFMFFFIVLNLGTNFYCWAQNKKVDSLIIELGKEKSEIKKIPILRQLSKAFTSVNPDVKYVYANQMRLIAEKYKIDSIISVAYLDMAMTHGIKTNYDSSMYYLTKGLKIAKEKNFESQAGRAYVGIGYTFDRLDNPKGAIENYRKALAIFKKLDNKKGLNQTYINLGSLYFDLREYKIAETYFKQVLQSFQKMNDESGMAYGYFILGNSSRALNNDLEAHDYYMKSLKIREKLGDLNGIALANFGLGELYLKQGKFMEAKKALKISIDNNIILNNKYQETVARNTLSDVLIGLKEITEAEKNAKRAYSDAKDVRSMNVTVTTLETLIDVQKYLKNYRKAFDYQSELILLNDSVNRIKVKKDFIYADFKRMRNENTDLESTNEVISLKNSAYEKGLYIITSLFVVVLILLFLYLRKIRQKNKVNQRLTLKSEEIKTINQTLERVNEELTVQNDVTSKQNAELEQINAVKNKFFSIVSHDLRSPIATLKMLFSTYFDGHLSQEEMNVLLKKLEENIFDTADFLDNLLEWSKSQLEGMMVNPEAFQVEAVLELNLKILQPQISAKGLRIEDSIECSAAVYADRNMINVVIRNILSNSIKFCHKGDAIILRCIDKSNTVLISVQDTGIGMQLDEQEKIFQLEHTISKGTSAEKGHHIGLVLCKDMVEQNGGKIWFESKEGVGTTFFIELPRNEI